MHTLSTAVRGRRGAAKTVALTLQTQPCQTLFTAQRWRTTAGAGLRLRVDSRTALTQLSFKVPAALLPAQTAKRRVAGFIRLYVGGQAKPLRYKLWLPKKGAAPRLLAAAGKPAVSFRKGGLRVTGLPLRTAVAEVTLYRVTKLDRTTSPRRLRPERPHQPRGRGRGRDAQREAQGAALSLGLRFCGSRRFGGTEQHHRGEGSWGRFAARAVVLRRVCVGSAIARVSQQSLETPRGWSLFAHLWDA